MNISSASTPEDSRYEQRTLSAVLLQLENGETHSEATDMLRELMAALEEAQAQRGGKPKGKLTLEIEFKLEDGMVEATPTVKVSGPKLARRKTLFWLTPNNNLTLRNPAQRELGLDVVKPPVVGALAG